MKQVYFLKELLKEKIIEINNDIEGYCSSSEIPIGETDNAIIIIKAISKDEAIYEGIEIDKENVCVEIK